MGDNGAMTSVMTAPKRSGKGFWIGGLLIGAGILLGIGGVAFGVKQINDVVNGLQRVPAVSGGTVELGEGTYQVFLEGPGADDAFGGGAFTVVGPDGTDLSLRPDRVRETYDFGGRSGRKLGRIEVTSPGTHQVAAGGSPTSSSADDLAFGRRGPVRAGLVPILGGVLGGVALGIAGVIVLIVTGVRRGRQRRMEANYAPAGGWGYPGPQTAPGYPPPGGTPGTWSPPPSSGSPPGWSPPPPPSGSPPGWSRPPPPPGQGAPPGSPQDSPPGSPPAPPGSAPPPAPGSPVGWSPPPPPPAWPPPDASPPDASPPDAEDQGEGRSR